MQDRLSKLNQTGLPPDPWKRFYGWRYDPQLFPRSAVFKGVFPGFTWGLGLFSILCVLEYLNKRKESHGELKK